MSEIEEQYKSVQARLDKVSGDLKNYAEESQKEMKKANELSAESKNNIDKALAEQAELKASVDSLEQKIAQLDNGGGSGRAMTAGELVAASEEFKNFDGGSSAARFTCKFNTFGPTMMNLGASVGPITEGDDASGGGLMRPQRVPGVFMLPDMRLTIRDLLSWGTTNVKDIEFVRESGFTNNADVVSENPASGKPQSGAGFEVDSAKVATIAHWIHASKQVLDDAGMLRSYIDGRLRFGLALKEEQQLLKGSGVGLNIDGIYTQAINYSNPGITPVNETRVDTIRLALLQAELADYYPDGVVLNPIDWTAIELQKDADNNYMFGGPWSQMIPRLWGRPVVPTKSMDQDDFLVGSFRQGAQGWDREQANVTVSTEDRDNFIKNMVTILGEERLALTVYRPESFVKGTFVSASS